MSTVSDQQLERFQSDGYLKIEGLLTPEEVERMRELYDRLFARPTAVKTGDYFDLARPDGKDGPALLPQIVRPSRYVPELADARVCQAGLEIARRLLGPEAAFRTDHAIFKPASIGAATPWHQDQAYYDNAEYDHESVSIWIPLQDVNEQNGCLAFIPGTHKLGVVPHHPINNDRKVEGLEIDEVDETKAVFVPLKAGDATVHHVRTFHYAGPNMTQGPRRAYILEYALPPIKREVAGDHYWNRDKDTARRRHLRKFSTRAGFALQRVGGQIKRMIGG